MVQNLDSSLLQKGRGDLGFVRGCVIVKKQRFRRFDGWALLTYRVDYFWKYLFGIVLGSDGCLCLQNVESHESVGDAPTQQRRPSRAEKRERRLARHNTNNLREKLMSSPVLATNVILFIRHLSKISYLRKQLQMQEL